MDVNISSIFEMFIEISRAYFKAQTHTQQSLPLIFNKNYKLIHILKCDDKQNFFITLYKNKWAKKN